RWRERQSEALLLRGSELEGARAWLAEWKAPAPEPTEVHRAFIGQSEAADREAQGAERRRLEEDAKRVAEARPRSGQLGLWLFVLLGVNIAVGVAAVWLFSQVTRQNADLQILQSELSETTMQLESLQSNPQVSAEIERIQRELDTQRQEAERRERILR